MTPKSQATKGKKKERNWTSSKCKTIFIKGYYQESKKIAHRTGKIFANYIFGKVLVSRILNSTRKRKQSN